jgi:hypothetical protein
MIHTSTSNKHHQLKTLIHTSVHVQGMHVYLAHTRLAHVLMTIIITPKLILVCFQSNQQCHSFHKKNSKPFKNIRKNPSIIIN